MSCKAHRPAKWLS